MRAAQHVIDWTLRLATAAALAIDAYVHADLIDLYARNRSDGLSQGDLFRVEAGCRRWPRCSCWGCPGRGG